MSGYAFFCVPGCISGVFGQPCQRLIPPTYWFIRGDLEPPCHMLPQMGTSPQAIQALWQQVWAIMDAKENRKRLCQAPRQHKLYMCTHVDDQLFAYAWSRTLEVGFLHLCVHLVADICWYIWRVTGIVQGTDCWQHLNIYEMQWRLAGQSMGKGVKLWKARTRGGGERCSQAAHDR